VYNYRNPEKFAERFAKRQLFLLKQNSINHPTGPTQQAPETSQTSQIPEVRPDDSDPNAPFQTFSWADWQQMQTNIICALSRFQRAAEHNQPDIAKAAVAEIFLTLGFLQTEARYLSDH
jgi:hypothetical protein